MINPVKTQFNLLFSTTYFGLAVHHQVEQKCKEIHIHYQCICVMEISKPYSLYYLDVCNKERIASVI